MKKSLITLAVLAVLAALFYYWSRPEPVTVTVVPVERGVVERTVANTRAGTVEACQRSRLALSIGGRIDRLLVDEGDQVVAGQLLMVLWNKDREAQLQVAQASEVSAQQEHQSICISAQSDLREARRLTNLAERNLVSEESADLAESRAQASSASCEAAKARVVQAAAAVSVAAAVLEQTFLRAPFDGAVAEVTGEVGEYATPSPPGVMTPPAIDLLTDDCHYISAPIDEVDASNIALGLPVRVTLDAFRDRVFPATVRRISPYILDQEKQARTVEVEAELEPLPEDVRLLAGYSADMEIILDSGDNALRIPSELVVDDEYVLVVDDEGILQRRQIHKGLTNWRYTEVLEGLKEGELIVSNIGSEGVEAGAPAKTGRTAND
ncbi:efflux RND transporter periplasmic adaptor subunit [Porticoccus hydrocarbonoclasticus]|uniref:efflux RND transporter periplasmic adaptor subunit n=1 Tax=Porticoccus hydrocarbonoclasticus TaxID=1073414 RepID=UPI00056640D5|nr:efflux RND transporter periplasmic adaptor subunit [Porticoccus hydrocarbonoclasticus]